ncbi:serine/threonine-protein kinase [Sphaerisporangium perillae]|uniref:serine/threonine-protein kinase n=1 Tax=Sphaerisporangium perillae TaxID=2935860 RepID=UPI002010A403|nr:serine/threonine-protein kinase [Sphaerisporangium perillae]
MGTPGQLVVKRYRLVRALGQGGMGMVWEGHDTLLDRPVAVKEVLVPHRLDSRQRLQMLHRTSREARTAARLNHRTIVAVYDVAEEDGHPWIIMELVPSRSLDRVLASEGPLSVPRAATIASEVLTALSVAHTAGVVHRDVKPANILIGYDGRVVLSDFGIATSLGDPYAQRSGTVGSAGFVAPERLDGVPAAPEGDLWSLGATLFATVVGRPPFENALGPLASLLTQDAELDRVPDELRPALSGLLAKDPARRMSASEAKRLLEPLRSPDAAPAPAGHGGAGRTKLLAGVTAAVVIAGAIGGWAVLRPSETASADPARASATGAPTASALAGGPTASASPAPSRLPLKWYNAERGWRAAVPRGWRLTIQEDYFTWAAPTGTAYFGVEVIDARGRDPLDLLREVEASLSTSVRKYRRIRLAKVPAKHDGATAPASAKQQVVAEWESTWTGPGYHSWAVKGVHYHEIQRMIVTGDQISVLDWTTTRTEWPRLRPTMDAIVKYYRPPGRRA